VPRTIAKAPYVSPYPILAADNFAAARTHIGDRVEVVGKITDVNGGMTRHGRPYIFINFGHWRGSIVKINVWSAGLKKLKQPPDASWIGKWVSVSGMLEPIYFSQKYGYHHIGISVQGASELRVIAEAEAKYRLGISTPVSGVSTACRNAKVLDEIRQPQGTTPANVPKGGRTSSGNARAKGSGTATGQPTQNQQVLEAMKAKAARAPAATLGHASGKSVPSRRSAGPGGGFWVVLVVVLSLLFFVCPRM
jgi:hypothetical protein